MSKEYPDQVPSLRVWGIDHPVSCPAASQLCYVCFLRLLLPCGETIEWTEFKTNQRKTLNKYSMTGLVGTSQTSKAGGGTHYRCPNRCMHTKRYTITYIYTHVYTYSIHGLHSIHDSIHDYSHTRSNRPTYTISHTCIYAHTVTNLHNLYMLIHTHALYLSLSLCLSDFSLGPVQ